MKKWRRFKYLPVEPLGEDGRKVTGSTDHIRLSRMTAAEGMVLLKNENHLLPLRKGSCVALFGKASVDYVRGGGGSGDVTVAYVRNLCDGMEEKEHEGKISLFEPLHDFYRKNVSQQYREGGEPGCTTEPGIPAELLTQAAAMCDTAIISICRYSAEGGDRKETDFYLSSEEQRMVTDVTALFRKVVVVLNVGGVVDTSWFVHEPKISSVLLAWQGGMEGAMAEADILCGDAVPSGKLTDTFAASLADYPSSANFNESREYVCYTDDIFVGYRYFETIPGAAAKVNYPFGFGLSYTSFDWACEKTESDTESIAVTIRVTNTGGYAGKEVIQLYTSAPKCSLEMPKLELRTFQKTNLLLPGESRTITLRVKASALSAYDEKLAAYVLPEGSYRIFVGTSVREIREVGVFEVQQERIIKQVKNRCVPKKLSCRLKADGSYEALETGEYAPVYDMTDWPEKAARDTEHILPDHAGVKLPEGRLDFEKVASGEIAVDDFLNRLTDDELMTVIGGTPNRGVSDTGGIGGLDYLGVPAAMTADGPAGLRIPPDRGIKTTAWPASTLLACTWDPKVIFRVGEAAAKEVRENNIGMWLAPAINIHRNPLCARNFEYYSEDPLVAGELASAMVQGIQSQLVSACVKHFCCNNKESYRDISDSRVSERALREIYLKAFEIVVKHGGVWSIMTSYNLLNGVYTSENEELLTGILREEWGYDGLVITDWWNRGEHYREALAGNNVRMPNGRPKRLQKAMELGLITRKELLTNAKQVLNWLLKLN